MGKLAELGVADSLIAAVMAGDREAAGRLYAKVADAAYGLARRLVGAAVAEDVLQDSMVKMYASLASYRGDAPFGAWLRRIVITQSLMQMRSPWQRARVLWDDFASRADELTNTDGAAGQAAVETTLDVERALRRLTPTARAVLWLYAVEGLSHAEIAAQFDRSESFSKTQLSRALKRLRPNESTPWLIETPRKN